jgi:hypothetical protein
MDAAIKKLVSGRLRAQAIGPHPDPELLAACAENSLSGRDRVSLLNHLAACTDCRDALYLAMPEADVQPVVAPAHWPRRWGMRWATLGASVLIIGVALLSDRGLLMHHSPSNAPPAKIAELKDQPATQLRDQPAETPIEAPPAIQTAARARPPAKHMTAKPQASMEFDQSGEVHLSAPLAGADANQVSVARSASTGAKIARTAWGLSPDGNVQHSLDSGATWQIVSVGEGLHFRAIGSVGNDVWVGGSAGALYRSVDAGQSWAKLPAISDDDITRIEFSDQRNGVVETAKGQVWSTSDGGQSWRSK